MSTIITDLRKLRQIVVISQVGTLTAASQILAVTQPALTKSVANVESMLGTKLFTRVPHGVRLTEAGEEFVSGAKRMLADAEDLAERVQGYQKLWRGRLRIGVAPLAYHPLLDRLVGSFAKENPALAMEMHGGTIEEIYSLLEGRGVEIALGWTDAVEEWPDVRSQSLGRLDMLYMARRKHPATNLKSVTEVDLLQYPVVSPSDPLTSATLTGLYVRNGLPPRTAQYQCDDFETTKRIVRSTDAVALVLSAGKMGNSVGREFHVFDQLHALQVNMGIAYAKSQPLSPASQAFCDHAMSFEWVS